MGAMNKIIQPDPADNFIEQMGLIAQGEGATRISGRIFGLMVMEGTPFTLQQMADRLQISKASASTNARQLANHGLLRLTSMPGVRQDCYELVPDAYAHMFTTMGDRMTKIASRLDEVERQLPSQYGDAKRRVQELIELYRTTAEVMAEVVRRLPKAR